MWDCIADDSLGKDVWHDPAFKIYRGLGNLVLLVYMWGVNIWVSVGGKGRGRQGGGGREAQQNKRNVDLGVNTGKWRDVRVLDGNVRLSFCSPRFERKKRGFMSMILRGPIFMADENIAAVIYVYIHRHICISHFFLSRGVSIRLQCSSISMFIAAVHTFPSCPCHVIIGRPINPVVLII